MSGPSLPGITSDAGWDAKLREVRALAFEEAAKEVNELYLRVWAEHREEIAGRGVTYTPATYAFTKALQDSSWMLRARAAEIRRNRVGPGETIPVAFDAAIGWHRSDK